MVVATVSFPQEGGVPRTPEISNTLPNPRSGDAIAEQTVHDPSVHDYADTSPFEWGGNDSFPPHSIGEVARRAGGVRGDPREVPEVPEEWPGVSMGQGF
jgi:hypothetical protein